jgi:hypothetical protein
LLLLLIAPPSPPLNLQGCLMNDTGLLCHHEFEIKSKRISFIHSFIYSFIQQNLGHQKFK